MSGEEDLVLRARQGDPGAFGLLVKLYWPKSVRLARSIVGEAEAEDAAQESFLRAWRKLATLREPAAFSAWLYRLTARVSLRRAGRRSFEFLSIESVAEPGSADNPGPRIDVDRLLASLPPRQRAVMHLTVVEGMSDREIGSILGIAASSVRAHRYRARKGLQKQIEEGGGR